MSLSKYKTSLITKKLHLLHPFYCQKQGLVATQLKFNEVKLNIFNPGTSPVIPGSASVNLEIPGLKIGTGLTRLAAELTGLI
jgi:hypothetical protein